MPIYEYYCPDNHRIYQFYAKTLAQGQTVPKCPDNPAFGMRKMISAFSVVSGGKEADGAAPSAEAPPGGAQAEEGDPRMNAAMEAMDVTVLDIPGPRTAAACLTSRRSEADPRRPR